ncbi:MAG: TetR/AcrR family transcriptional regulator [Colwellia sp.]
MKVKDKKALNTSDVRNVFLKGLKKNDEIPLVRRSKGVLTREKILEAAITEMAKTGVKGTTHRAIANRADLQLSLTTYYFKDIYELIHHAFMLNANKSLINREVIFEKIFVLLSAFKMADIRKAAVKKILLLQLVELFVNYIMHSTEKSPELITVERLMFIESQFSKDLHKVTKEYETASLSPYIKLCHYFDKTNTAVNAYLLQSIITELQCSLISQLNGKVDRDFISQNVKKVMTVIMKIKH